MRTSGKTQTNAGFPVVAGEARRRRSGFTLLELVLAMAIMALIVGMVFGTARTSLALGHTITESQNEEMLQQAFFELLGQRFSSLPGNTRFDLKVQDSGAHYLTDLTLQNVPLSFTWGGQDRVAKAVQLSTVKRRSGFLDIVLRYYENEILEGSESSPGSSVADNKPMAEIVLLSDVAYFEWRALDGRSMEWQYDWDIQGRLPLQLELTMAIGAKGEEIRQIFWIPPKQNPEIMMRQMQQTGGGGGSNNGGSGQGEDGNIKIEIPGVNSGGGGGGKP
jgi:prepilin-type N-terminal cleavage/methylation domain-containing protein